ncbi:MAG: DUF72 domain-containing protein, partial [Cytophagaceae bacterium]
MRKLTDQSKPTFRNPANSQTNKLYERPAGRNSDHEDLYVEDHYHSTSLATYATSLSAVEINSSFYRPHRPQTWQRWAESVPAGFRFSVKMPKSITHEHRLQGCEHLLEQFWSQAASLRGMVGNLAAENVINTETFHKTVFQSFDFFFKNNGRFVFVSVNQNELALRL